MSDASLSAPDAGRFSALAAYGFYLLSIPSAGFFALLGVIVAYVGRSGAGPLAQTHLANAIDTWWTAFWWTLAAAIISLVGWALAIVLIGIPLIWIGAAIALIVMLWFSVKSVLGIVALLDGRPV
jgi:uncharacterized membrane protein